MTADWSMYKLNFSPSPASSGDGTQQRATCWICVCWCFGSPTTALVLCRSAVCWLTAGARWGGLWAATSCWSRANTLCSAALLTTGTALSPRGQVSTPTSDCFQENETKQTWKIHTFLHYFLLPILHYLSFVFFFFHLLWSTLYCIF